MGCIFAGQIVQLAPNRVMGRNLCLQAVLRRLAPIHELQARSASELKNLFHRIGSVDRIEKGVDQAGIEVQIIGVVDVALDRMVLWQGVQDRLDQVHILLGLLHPH